MLIDSGADTSVFDKDVASVLDLKIKSGQLMETSGLSGRISGVLGRKDVFEYFKISIDEKHKEIEFKENH